MFEVLLAIGLVVTGAIVIPFFGYLFGRFVSIGFLRGIKAQFTERKGGQRGKGKEKEEG